MVYYDVSYRNFKEILTRRSEIVEKKVQTKIE